MKKAYHVMLFGAMLITAALLVFAVDFQTRVFGAIVIFGGLIYLVVKIEGYVEQLQELNRLQAAYSQLDQQAKLIIRSDVELHRIQDELDRRLGSLMSLHQLGRQLQVSHRPDEIYGKLDQSVVSDFGFTKGLLGICPAENDIEWCSLISVTQPVAEALKTHLTKSTLLKTILDTSTAITLEYQSTTDPEKRKLLELLDISSAVIYGVKPNNGPAGCLILGRADSTSVTSKADEELIAILINQLAIAVDNSALFEEIWSSQRALEIKVKKRTQELADANTELINLNKSKSDFVSAVSHELRTPLAAVKGYASLINSGQFGPLEEAQKERLLKIEKHVDLLTQLINNLLDIARIESGRITMEREPIPVDEFLLTVHEMVRPQIEEKQINYDVNVNNVEQLIGDSTHLQRVFMNLLSNAIKYTPEKGTIRLEMKRENNSIIASVSDTGCGISKDEIPKLFQQFYRTSDPINQKIRGTGLGLALVKQIIEAHNGTIWVTSEKNKGSVFSIKIPAV